MNGILYEDNDIIVCHKKSGIPVQSARIGQKDMVSILNNHLAEQAECTKGSSKTKQPQQIYVVHRLDQPVEGVIVFAKNKKAAAGLGRQITDGSMKKQYQAVVCVTHKGQELLNAADAKRLSASADVSAEADSSFAKAKQNYQLIDYLAKDGRTNRSEVVQQDHQDAKRAELAFSVLNDGWRAENGSWHEVAGGGKNIDDGYHSRLESGADCSEEMDKAVDRYREGKRYARVAIDLKTGRHHQIRVQMAHAGLPLYGDQKYHSGWQDYVLEQEKTENELFGFFGSAPAKKNPSLALCSVRLIFNHPVTGKKLQFETKPTTEAFVFCSEPSKIS